MSKPFRLQHAAPSALVVHESARIALRRETHYRIVAAAVPTARLERRNSEDRNKDAILPGGFLRHLTRKSPYVFLANFKSGIN
jgi:hypothetical protein